MLLNERFHCLYLLIQKLYDIHIHTYIFGSEIRVLSITALADLSLFIHIYYSLYKNTSVKTNSHNLLITSDYLIFIFPHCPSLNIVESSEHVTSQFNTDTFFQTEPFSRFCVTNSLCECYDTYFLEYYGTYFPATTLSRSR